MKTRLNRWLLPFAALAAAVALTLAVWPDGASGPVVAQGGDTPTATVTPTPSSALSVVFVDPGFLEVGDRSAVVLEVTPSGGTLENFRLTAGTASFATIDSESGVLTAVAPGVATVLVDYTLDTSTEVLGPFNIPLLDPPSDVVAFDPDDPSIFSRLATFEEIVAQLKDNLDRLPLSDKLNLPQANVDILKADLDEIQLLIESGDNTGALSRLGSFDDLLDTRIPDASLGTIAAEAAKQLAAAGMVELIKWALAEAIAEADLVKVDQLGGTNIYDATTPAGLAIGTNTGTLMLNDTEVPFLIVKNTGTVTVLSPDDDTVIISNEPGGVITIETKELVDNPVYITSNKGHIHIVQAADNIEIASNSGTVLVENCGPDAHDNVMITRNKPSGIVKVKCNEDTVHIHQNDGVVCIKSNNDTVTVSNNWGRVVVCANGGNVQITNNWPGGEVSDCRPGGAGNPPKVWGALGGVANVRCNDPIALACCQCTLLTPTPTPTPTPTHTPTPTPPPTLRMEKDLDEDATEVVDATNLFLEMDEEGNVECLDIYELVSNAGNDPDGVGAYEFQLKFDHKIFDITIEDSSWLSNEGTRVVDCTMTIISENDIRWGCVSSGPTPGQTADGVAAIITVCPEPDLVNRLTPGQDNGMVRTLLDENCQLADIYGDPLPGSLPGGLTEVCGDATVTVRILEADLNLDCAVNVLDEQAIAFRYGAFFDNLLYDPWYDLEPALKDFDIDIKDLQKVFGRDGSTCQSPIPEQPPLPPQP